MSIKHVAGVVPELRLDPIAAAAKTEPHAHRASMSWASKAFVATAMFGGFSVQHAGAAPIDCEDGAADRLECGPDSIASDAGTVAVGVNNFANGVNSDGFGSTAVGNNNKTYTSSRANALGGDNAAFGAFATAVGDGNRIGTFKTDANGDFERDGNGHLIVDGGTDNDFATAVGYGNILQANTGAATGNSALGDRNWNAGVRNTVIGSKNVIGVFNTGADGVSAVATGFVADGTAIGSGNIVTGSQSSALGVSNSAASDGNVVIGNKSTIGISAGNAIVIGTSSDVLDGARNSIVMGLDAGSSDEDGIAIGRLSVAQNAGAIAIGTDNAAAGVRSVAIGRGSVTGVNAQGAVAIGGATSGGTGATALSAFSNAIGRLSFVDIGSDGATAIGSSASVGQASTGSFAMGTNAKVGNSSVASFALGTGASVGDGFTGGIAFGANSVVGGAYGVALGSNAQSTAPGAVAIGTESIADVADTISVGNAFFQRNIVNVRAGVNDTDAVNVSQLRDFSDALGGGAEIDGGGDLIFNNVSGQFEVGGVGYATVADAIAAAGGGGVCAPGAGPDTVICGTGATAAGNRAAAFGYDADAVGGFSLAAGAFASAVGDYSVALGVDASATKQRSVAIGIESSASADNSVALGANSVADVANTISVGSAGGERRIVNVDEGTNDTDAVNVSQLRGVTDLLGAGVDVDGSIIAPTYNIQGSPYNGVGAAFAALDSELSGLGGALDDALLFDGATYNATRMGNPTVITGVANGAVTATSTDAVNGSQIFGLQSQIDDNAADLTDLQTDVGNLQTDVAQNTSDIAALGGQVASNTSAIAGNTTAIANNTTAINSLGSQVTNLGNKVDQNTAAISNLGTQVGANTTAINNLDGRVTNVEGDIANLNQQITNVGAGTAAAQETADEALAAAGAAQQSADTAQGTADEAMQLALGNDGRAFCSRGAGEDSIRCGTNTKDDVTGANGIGIGTDAQAIADGSIAMGHNATAVQSNSIAIGAGARAESSVAVGTGAQATGTNTTAIGDNAEATGEFAVAVGNNAQATANNSVALGNGSVADQENTVSVGSATQQRRVTNVAAGIDDTDAVNVSQLNAYRDEMSTRIYNQGKRINSVGALSAALAMSAPDYRLKGDFQLNVGLGHYSDRQAIGATFAGLINDRTSLRVGGSYADDGESMLGVGMGFSW